MKLIIAEKPSLARNIVNAIGNLKKKDGYFENEEYLITWAFGHLFTLYDIEDYNNETDRKWKMDNLPFFPREFKFNLKKDKDKKVDSGVLKQFNIIKDLCNKEEVDTIINAGDSDREGEIIIRLCINNALEKEKKLVRLWLPDQTPKTVNEALSDMKDESNYDNLANEGFARTYVDWLYGVNLTRYASIKTGTLLRVGRVIVPIVKAIYDRDRQIEEFVPDIYYGIQSNEITNGEEVELVSKEKFEKEKLEDAKKLCDEYNKETAVVVDKKVKKDILQPGKLYSLTKLQNYLGKKYKMPMDKSLAIVQKLYEEGYLTYPRTNSEYLATNEKGKIKDLIEVVSKLGYKVKFKDKKTIFDDSKIESHSALTPTYKIPKKENMSEDEIKVYTAVMRRFAAVFCSEDCKIEKTEIKIKLGSKEEFTLKGNVIIEKGWTVYDEASKNDKVLPNLNINDIVNIDFKPKEKKKSPPKHYTIETLNNYLKNPFKEDKAKLNEEEDSDDTEEYKAIFEGLELGTEATRTGIINNAINSKYIELKKDVYYILPGGKYLIESLANMNISMDKYKTSTLGKGLKQVYKGNIQIDDVVNLTEKEIKEVFDNEKGNDTTGIYMEKIGICPLCGKDVVKGRYNYNCLGYKEGCNFKISFNICKKLINKQIAKTLLENKITDEIKGFISKNNKEFSSKLKLEEDGKISFVFN